MWLTQISARERRTVLASFLGYGVDGFDFMLYSFVIPTLMLEWGLTRAQAGSIATAALLTSALGGWAAGVLADRFGRVRILGITVLWFCVFTVLSGFTQSYRELLLTRALQGVGFGGEWSVGSLLVAETIAARLRGRAAGLVQSSWACGWAAAALAFWAVYSVVPPALGWRMLFWLGGPPAVLVVYLRRRVQESPAFLAALHAPPRDRPAGFLDIFRPALLRTTVLATLMCAGMLAAYYSVTTWLPTFLKTERGLSVTDTSGYLLVLIAGSLAGYLSGAWACDALGRRRTIMGFAACAMALVLGYTVLPVTDGEMLWLGFPLGFFLSGVMAGMGALLAELYPTAVRGSGQGFCYNGGRAASALSPLLIGVWSAHASLGPAIGAFTVGSYVLVIAAAWSLPETRGRELVPRV